MNTSFPYSLQTQQQQSSQSSESSIRSLSIDPPHWEDWTKSQVDPDLINLNVISLDYDRPYEYLCYSDKIKRLTSGRLPSSTIRLYEHTEAGGWWCNGLDPFENWRPMLWGCFKPDRPRVAGEKQKLIKYEHPYKTSCRAFFLDVSDKIAQKVADRIQETAPKKEDFWRWVTANPKVPIVITEGVKKAGCLLSQGYAAIALPGIYGGYSKVTNPVTERTVDRTLLPELKCIATPGRQVLICFDNDDKVQTRKNVQSATRNLSNILDKHGAQVSVMEWEGQSKGIDDLVAIEGPEALHQAYDNALPWQLWLYDRHNKERLTIEPTIRLNTPELQKSQLEQWPTEGILVLASGKGTGKTNLIAELLKDEPKVISVGHRVALQRNICDRWNLHFKNDLDKFRKRFANQDGYIFRIGLCIDSLLCIKAEDVAGGVLVIDEFMQVLRHLFLGETCATKGNRGAIIEHLTHLISVARLVILADADACDLGINYIQLWRSKREEKPVLVCNDYVSPGFNAIFLETKKIEDCYQRMTEAVKAGRKIFTAMDTRGGALKLAEKLKKQCPQKKGLLISSATSGGREQRAFITNPNLHVHRYDWIIATPSLGTGVSIEVDHFDEVYGIFRGVLTDGDASQAINRIRCKISRTIWAEPHGQNRTFMSQSIYPKVIQYAIRRRDIQSAQVLRSQLGFKLTPRDREDDLSHSDPNIDFYCGLLALENISHMAFRTALKVRLQQEGNTITEVIPENHSEEFSKAMRDIGLQIKQNEALQISQARNLTFDEVKCLSYQEIISQEVQQAIEKYRIQSFFCRVNITPEDVIFYSKFHQPLRQLEALLYGCAVSIARDQTERDAQLQWGSLLTPWDFKHHETKRFIREKLGIRAFLNTKCEWTSKQIESIGATVRHCRKDIKLFLNLTVQEDSNNNWILSQLLSQIGLKTKVRHKGRRGQQEAVYSLDDEHFAIVAAILQRRQEYRLSHGIESQSVQTLLTEPEDGNRSESQLGQETPQFLQGSNDGIYPVLEPSYLYSKAGSRYEMHSEEGQTSPSSFISTDKTILLFKNWIQEQCIVVKQFFFPDRFGLPIVITAT